MIAPGRTQNVEILLYRFSGDAQNAPDVGADVFHLAGAGVDHQKHVVHVAGKA